MKIDKKKKLEIDELSLIYPLVLLILILLFNLLKHKHIHWYYYMTIVIMPFFSYILLQKIILEKYAIRGIIYIDSIPIVHYLKLFNTGITPCLLYIFIVKIIRFKGLYANIILLVIFCFSVYFGSFLFQKYVYKFSILYEKKLEQEKLFSKEDYLKILGIYIAIYYLISHSLINF